MPLIAVIFGRGGIGDVGRHAVKHCVARGIPVRAISREPEQLGESIASITQLDGLEGEVEGLEKVKVDLLSPNTTELEKALEGVDAVISCVGNRQSKMERWAAIATNNIVKAMKNSSVNRLIALTSVGLNEDWPPLKWHWAGKFFSVMLCTNLRSAYYDLAKAEKIIKDSTLDYLIVRPTGLNPQEKVKAAWDILPAKSNGMNEHGVKCGITIAKEDVSTFLVNEALDATLHMDAVTVSTSSPNHENGESVHSAV